MTREEKLEAIYKEMANKELTFGCKVKFSKWVYKIIDRENTWFLTSYEVKDWVVHNTIVIEDRVNSRCYSIEEIIWHPVTIGDVLDRYRTNNNDYKVREIDPYDLKSYSAFQEYDIKRLLNLWTEKRTLIDEQSDECIDFVHSLIKKS